MANESWVCDRSAAAALHHCSPAIKDKQLIKPGHAEFGGKSHSPAPAITAAQSTAADIPTH